MHETMNIKNDGIVVPRLICWCLYWSVIELPGDGPSALKHVAVV